MTSGRLLAYAYAFLGSELRLGYLGLITNPRKSDFRLMWHRDVLHLTQRDFQGEDGAPKTTKLRWTLALRDEASLRLVPGSHRRWATDYELKCMTHHLHVDLPDQRIIRLRAGQTVFYDEKIIHRAQTPREPERSSLFGTWAQYRKDEPKVNPIPEMRWMLREGVRQTFPDSLRTYYDRWREIYQSQAPDSPLITHAARAKDT
jgi:hypothetical protein